MAALTCPRCKKETPHESLEYQAQHTHTKHGHRQSTKQLERKGEWVRCLDCHLIHISTEERKPNLP